MNPEAKEEITPAEPDEVKDPAEADDADPGEIAEAKAAQKEEESETPGSVSAGAFGAGGSSSSTTEEEPTETHYVEVELKYEDNGDPVKGEQVKIKLPDGTSQTKTTDDEGKARIEGIKKTGQCEVNFTKFCKKEWKKA